MADERTGHGPRTSGPVAPRPPRTVAAVSTHPPLPSLLPPPAAPSSTTDRVVDRAVPLVHDLLDDLRAGPLGRSGSADHEVKDDGTPVTTADVEVDERITAMVDRHFDGHGVVSEELDAVAGDHEWQWVVDPIDGTSNFAAGLPHWGVSIALCHGGVPVFGVIDAPRFDHRWEAVRGRGCSRDGRAVHVREDVVLDDPLTAHLPLITSLEFLVHVRRDAGVRLHPRVLGAGAVDAGFVADGTAVASVITRGKVWDVAAGAVIVTEAGGAAARLAGEVLPLVPATDYAARPLATAFGSSAPLLAELMDRLLPADSELRPG